MSNARDKYSDIIDMPHHQSTRRSHMSLHDRAAQFAPFAALSGYDDEISETARLTDRKLELSEEEEQILNDRIHMLNDSIKKQPEVRIVYFVPDERKSGGAYVTTVGNVRRVDELEGVIIFTDGTKIDIADIYSIDSELFASYKTPVEFSEGV